MIEILTLAVLSALGVYAIIGAGLYLMLGCWLSGEYFDTREFVHFVLAWPTELFG